MHHPSSSRNNGLTILEVLISAGIITLLSAIVIIGLLPLQKQTDVAITSQQIITTLQLARNRALASVDDESYGVHFESNLYVLFTGTTYSASDPDNEVRQLSSDIEINNISIGGGDNVVFDRLIGTTSNSGSITLRQISDPTDNRTISILPIGASGLTGSVTQNDTRLTDTRHVHFDLGWSIQGATTLSLIFADPPVQENVTMADYFNIDQTSFDWEGTIDVNGSDQTLRVHTHSLDASDTQLSIHRDRLLNNKAVDITIDGQPIVSYALDGTATVGGSGGTMTVQ